MTAILALLATSLTLAGLLYLALTDKKRRRILALPAPRFRRRTPVALLAVFGPGVLLLVGNQSAGFLIWFATTSVLGWLVVCLASGSGHRPSTSNRFKTVPASRKV